MTDPPNRNFPDQDRDRDSYVRWQGIAITQLGYTINLMMALSGAVLGFVVKGKLDGTVEASGRGWHSALILLGCSVLIAIVANVTRALDFRYTRRALRSRMKDGDTGEHRRLHDVAECLGTWTWGLFYCQAAGFLVGILFLAASLCPFL